DDLIISEDSQDTEGVFELTGSRLVSGYSFLIRFLFQHLNKNGYEHNKDDYLKQRTAELEKILRKRKQLEGKYRGAKTVWKVFGMKNMGDYHDLYLKTDVLILADVFENFRKECLKHYKLDPCHYFSSPGLSWDSMLKMTGVKLELMSDVDMFQFIERGMRGGVSYIAHRHSEANNKHMSDYDEEKSNKHIIYLDANNLYGWAMSQNLPTGGFRWITLRNKERLDHEKGGLILEVDLEYPKELHDLHNGYPLAPERMMIEDSMLSGYCREVKEKFNLTSGNIHKLITNLNGKKNYVVHYKNLMLYKKLGFKVTKIHKALKFNQSPWLKDLIDYPKESKFYFGENKKAIGKMKDEAAGVPITEFVGLRSKMYSYTKEGGTQLHHKMQTIRWLKVGGLKRWLKMVEKLEGSSAFCRWLKVGGLKRWLK
ncbi:Gastrula zinc finger, partial [Paramuricea clavata]